MRLASDVSRPRIGPGPALVVVGAGRLAGFVALVFFQCEISVVAAEPVDRDFLSAGARLNHARAAHARDAATILDALRHVALQPADLTADDFRRVVETPGPPSPVALAQQGTIRP